MEIEGRIAVMLPSRGGTSKNGNQWAAQSFVLEFLDNNFTRHVCLEVFGADKIGLFKLQEGEHIRASFAIDAREYEGRWFNSLRVWKVERVGGNTQLTQSPQQDPALLAQPAQTPSRSSDLPF